MHFTSTLKRVEYATLGRRSNGAGRATLPNYETRRWPRRVCQVHVRRFEKCLVSGGISYFRSPKYVKSRRQGGAASWPGQDNRGSDSTAIRISSQTMTGRGEQRGVN